MSPSLTPATRERLRIAIQKSGRLAEPARTLLAACGLSWRESRDKLFCYGESLPVDLLLVRDDDIPGLIADGVCDLGIVGRNELDEQAGARARIGLPQAYRALRGLGFGQCRLMLAVPEEWDWTGPDQLRGKGTRIATSYPAILANWLDAQGIDAQVVELSGSVEIALRFTMSGLVRRNLLRHVLARPGAAALPYSIGETISRFRDDAYLAEDSVDWTDEIVSQGLVALVAFAVLLYVNAHMALVVVLPLLIVVLLLSNLMRYADGIRGH